MAVAVVTPYQGYGPVPPRPTRRLLYAYLDSSPIDFAEFNEVFAARPAEDPGVGIRWTKA